MEISWSLLWLGLAVLLGIAEVLGASGFLIGAAMAAVAMAIATWIFPNLGVVPQFIYFAIAATIATYVYFKFFRSIDPNKGHDLHDKVGAMVGTQFVLKDDVPQDINTRTQIDDSLWTVHAKSDLEQGTVVRIVGGDASMIEIEAVN